MPARAAWTSPSAPSPGPHGSSRPGLQRRVVSQHLRLELPEHRRAGPGGAEARALLHAQPMQPVRALPCPALPCSRRPTHCALRARACARAPWPSERWAATRGACFGRHLARDAPAPPRVGLIAATERKGPARDIPPARRDASDTVLVALRTAYGRSRTAFLSGRYASTLSMQGCVRSRAAPAPCTSSGRLTLRARANGFGSDVESSPGTKPHKWWHWRQWHRLLCGSVPGFPVEGALPVEEILSKPVQHLHEVSSAKANARDCLFLSDVSLTATLGQGEGGGGSCASTCHRKQPILAIRRAADSTGSLAV